jgi:hypothetical protein
MKIFKRIFPIVIGICILTVTTWRSCTDGVGRIFYSQIGRPLEGVYANMNVPEISRSSLQLPRCCCMGSGPSAMCWPPPNVTGGRAYKILWHSNQFGLRGTEIALFDYASAFEDLLCGVSHVETFKPAVLDSILKREPLSSTFLMESHQKFKNRFPGRTHLLASNERSELASLIKEVSPDVFYAIQAGNIGHTLVWPTPEKGGHVKTLLHAVFSGNEPHFDRYAVVSDSVERSAGIPVVHHMAYLEPHLLALPNLRIDLGIPRNARVFCRHGGADTMNIMFVRDAICSHANEFPNDYFLFLGTNPEDCEKRYKNIIHVPKTANVTYKQQFLNSCNACVHARSDGETFGLSVAECSLSGLPVITYCDPPEGATFHLKVLKENALPYCNSVQFLMILKDFDVMEMRKKRDVFMKLYKEFSPGPIMLEFMVNFGILDDFMSIVNPRGMSWWGKCEPFFQDNLAYMSTRRLVGG